MKRGIAIAGSLLILSGCADSMVDINEPESSRTGSVKAEGDRALNSDFDLGGSIGFLGENPGIEVSSADIGIMSDIQLANAQLGVDFRVAGLGGTRNIGAGPISLSGISGPVSKAVLYWHGPTNTANTNVTVSVDGQVVNERSLGFSSDNCWGFSNSQAWAADITSIVAAKGNGSYQITGLTGGPVNSNGASIVVYYSDGNPANNRDVVVFEGNDSNINNSFDANGWNVTLAGINYTSGVANMQLHVADGQTFTDAAITINNLAFLPAGPLFNGNTVPAVSNGPFNNGSLWDIRSFNVTSFLTVGTNTLALRTGVFSDCLALVVALVDLPAGAAPPNLPVDNLAPDANAGPDQTVNLSGSTMASVTLNGTASTDDGRPNGIMTYSWKKGAVSLGTSATLTTSLGIGTHTITLTVSDGALSDTDDVVITVVDPSPPQITSTVVGTLGSNGWYTTPVTVSWTVTDLESAVTSAPCAAQTQTADIASQTFSCSATSAGGTSNKSETFKKDGTNPAISFSGSLSYTVDQTVLISCTATDNLSGVATSTCGSPVASGAAYTFALGNTTKTASATDNAGNATNSSITFNVTVTYESLCNLVKQIVTHHGVANSLCVKLNAAEASRARGNTTAQQNQLGAFINEVEAQSGQKVPADKAPILIALANALM